MSQGFTLIEILVVPVLMGLAAGLVAPAIIASTGEGESGVAANQVQRRAE